MSTPYESRPLPSEFDLLAPDGSEIRLMPVLTGGSMVHCALPPGTTSLAIRHRTVEELWFIIAGQGELWRRQGGREEVVQLTANTSHSIPLGTDFQFRNAGKERLEFIIATMPPWPGPDEAVRVTDHWPTEAGE